MNENIYTSEERILTTLAHKEPDRIPFDLGSLSTGGITLKAYKALLEVLGIEKKNIEIAHISQQLAKVHEDVLTRLNVDTRGFEPLNIPRREQKIRKKGDYYVYSDEFGIVRSMPVDGGFYFDITEFPLAGELDIQRVNDYSYPDHRQWINSEKLRKDIIDKYNQTNCAMVIRGSTIVVERVLFLRGFEDGLMDFAGNFDKLSALIDRILENRILFWAKVIDAVGDVVHIMSLNDDLAGQESLLFSPEVYRKYVKPIHRKIFSFIKERAPNVKILFHSCGSVYSLIGDLIEIGVDILNPVQVSARDMDPKKLKNEFGNDIVFWGGGVDTQYVLPQGTPDEVRDDVKRRIDDFAPGGGFVFNTVHNIQEDVPPENVIAMWETLMEYGKY